MTQFSTRRFLSVARWDLAINRSFYARSALVIFVVMALPALMDLTFGPLIRAVAVVAYGAISNYITMLPLLFGYMLHNLCGRQGRISELTLPASNLEKFLWHVCLILFGSLFVAVVSFFAIDLLYNLVVAVCLGPDYVREFAVPLVRVSEMDLDVRFSLTVTLLYLLLISTFVLGNALKYRHNIALTIVWDMMVVFLAVIASLTAITLRVRHLARTMDTGLLHLGDIVDFYGTNLAVCSLMVCLIVLCWWWAYRLYARASITSRRNP